MSAYAHATTVLLTRIKVSKFGLVIRNIKRYV
jgi:hypothetical protein